MTNDLRLEHTPIPGLLVLHLPVHEDARGWFKENWQREKMLALGLPDFGPVQQNVSFNARRGATRGIHTEPWDKLVSLATGRAFGAWVDMREGDSFGSTFTTELTPGVAVFVPRGVGNSYQTLEDDVAYTYLVNDHWRPGLAYPALALDDATSAIPWPIPLTDSEISEKDHTNPIPGRRHTGSPPSPAGHRLPRAARSSSPGGIPQRRRRRPRRARPHRRRGRCRLALARPRRHPERGGLHRRRRRGDPRGARRGLGRQRSRAGDARTGRRRARPHPRALLERVRLRRHPRAAHRGRAAVTAGGLRTVEGRG